MHTVAGTPCPRAARQRNLLPQTVKPLAIPRHTPLVHRALHRRAARDARTVAATSIPHRTASTSLAPPRPSTTALTAASILRMIFSRTSARMPHFHPSIHPFAPYVPEYSTRRRRGARHVIIPVSRRVAIALPAPLASGTRMGDEQDIRANTHCRRTARGRAPSQSGVVFHLRAKEPVSKNEEH
ncbi:hypothetical protein B0H14DRAFT_3487068 [Mycena olivaceomarginata]|nr:hypothetical protein B0H14DRAFT_3487068 [Mycena olivaceomarginata]